MLQLPPLGYVALGAVIGFALGVARNFLRRPHGFQNRGEVLVSQALRAHFGAPDYHLMNHVTLAFKDGSTQVDHILVSRFGVFVIEAKDYKGWIFANASQKTWTQVLFRRKFKFQNPIFQNLRHVLAIERLLDFLPPGAVKSVVVFTDRSTFKTEKPAGVLSLAELVAYLRGYQEEVMSVNRVQFCVGRLETARFAISAQTDVEHVENLARRHGKSNAGKVT